MAIVAGALAKSIIGKIENPRLSSGMRGFEVEYWPPHASEVVLSPRGDVARTLPVAANARPVPGAVAHSFFLDFYFCIQILPSAFDMGNLVTSQNRQVTVWNAWPNRAVTLDSVETQNADGINLSAPGALPMTFNPLQQRVWQLSVTPDGPPVIDAVIMWIFTDGIEPGTVKITGNRITAWMVPPDWATSVTETLSWMTDVQQSYNGSQTRLVCREAPRREWEFSAIAHERERQILEAALYDWTARRWALPVWTDVTWLAVDLDAGITTVPVNTVGLDYVVGGLAMLWSAAWRFELVEVLDVAAGAIVLKNATSKAWAKGDRLYPCRTAMLTDAPSLPRSTSNLVTTQVRFMAAEPCDWPAIAPTANYLGYPVLETRPDESQAIAAAHGRQMTTVDNDTGIPIIDDPTGLAWPTQAFNWLLSGRAARATHRSLLYWLQGRASALWLPSWTDDIELAQDILDTATVLTIAWIGYVRFLHQREGRRHIRIELKDGAVFYRRITASSEVDENNEALLIDSALGRSITRRQVRQISWMMLATLNADKVDIAHVHDSIGVATSTATFVGVPREEP